MTTTALFDNEKLIRAAKEAIVAFDNRALTDSRCWRAVVVSKKNRKDFKVLHKLLDRQFGF